MRLLHNLISYQSNLLNVLLNRKLLPGVLCALSLLPCFLGTSIIRAFLYFVFILLLGSSGVFVCRNIGVDAQLCVLGFTIFAFLGVLVLETIERLLNRKIQKEYHAMMKVLSCCCFPAAVLCFYHNYLLSIVSLGLCIVILTVCNHLRTRNKRQFYTYEDLLLLSDREDA